MQIHKLFLIIFLFFIACKNKDKKQEEQKFDKSKWGSQVDKTYPQRNLMIKDLINNHTLKGLKKEEVYNLLGEPSRTNNGYLYYTIDQQFFPNTSWPIHTKTLVIKLTKDSTVEWRKIHE